MKTKWLMAAVAVTLVGCATTKVLTPVGGSRSDGIVRLAYDVTMFQKPRVNFEEGRVTAQARCQSWGYTNAEQFGGHTSVCHARNGYGNCMQETITYEFQCTGAKTPQ